METLASHGPRCFGLKVRRQSVTDQVAAAELLGHPAEEVGQRLAGGLVADAVSPAWVVAS